MENSREGHDKPTGNPARSASKKNESFFEADQHRGWGFFSGKEQRSK